MRAIARACASSAVPSYFCHAAMVDRVDADLASQRAALWVPVPLIALRKMSPKSSSSGISGQLHAGTFDATQPEPPPARSKRRIWNA